MVLWWWTRCQDVLDVINTRHIYSISPRKPVCPHSKVTETTTTSRAWMTSYLPMAVADTPSSSAWMAGVSHIIAITGLTLWSVTSMALLVRCKSLLCKLLNMHLWPALIPIFWSLPLDLLPSNCIYPDYRPSKNLHWITAIHYLKKLQSRSLRWRECSMLQR